MVSVLFIAIALIVTWAVLSAGGRQKQPEPPQLDAAPLPPLPPLPDATQLPGADPSQPIPVPSPAVIEDRAERWPCPVCAGDVRCLGHGVESIAGRRLRVASLRCVRCGFARAAYFELRAQLGPSAPTQGS